jgi:hypothetical protein
LLIFLIYGVGSIAGSVLSGYYRDAFAIQIPAVLDKGGKVIEAAKTVDDWTKIWIGPFALTLVCMLIFALLFNDKEEIKHTDVNLSIPSPEAA